MKQSSSLKNVVWLLMGFVIVAQASATVDLINPLDQEILGSQDVDFDYYPDLAGGVEDCALEIGGSILLVDTNVTNSAPNVFQVTNLPQGSLNWRVLCSNFTSSESSSVRNFNIDLEDPVVTLLSPGGGDTTGSSVTFTFKSVDSMASETNCELNVDGQSKETMNSTNNTQTSFNVIVLSQGNHNWTVVCEDGAGNSGNDTGNFSVEEELTFTIELDKDSYSLGENAILTITAPDMSNLTLDVCPDGEGFVECFSAITLQEENYPLEETIPYTTKAGDFIIDAFFAYQDVREARRELYSVTNDLEITIDAETEIKQGRSVTIKGDSSGGLGALSYEWTLHNGSKSSGKEINLLYATAGDFVESLEVTDEQGNSKTKSVTIKVATAYEIIVRVKDSETNEYLEGAAVDLDDDKESTNTEGMAEVISRSGTQDLLVFLTGYEIYEGSVNIDSSRTIEVSLTRPPKILKIAPVSPTDGSTLEKGVVDFEFNITNITSSECTLYLDKALDGFFSEKGSTTLSEEGVHKMSVELDEGEYVWVVECVENGREAETPEISIEVVEQEEEEEEASESDEPQATTYNPKIDIDQENMLDALGSVLEVYAKSSSKERDIAESLGLEKELKDMIKKVQRSSRDVHDLRFRTSMTEEEKEEEKERIQAEIRSEYQNIVKSIEVKDSKNFVKYPEKEELQLLVEQYAQLNNFEEKTKGLVKAISGLQENILVSTKTSVVRIERLDGSEEIITTIKKEIKSEDLPDNSFFVEFVPKEVAMSVEDMTIVGDYEVLDEDPVLKFDVQDTIIYYVKGEIGLEEIKKTSTLTLIEDIDADLKGITGGVSFIVPSVDFGSKTFLISIIIILLLIYALSGTSLGSSLFKNSKKKQDKEYHYLKVLINDSKDNLDANNYEKASMIYREIKMTFETVNPGLQDEIFPEILDLVNNLDIAYSRDVSVKIEQALDNKDYELAQHLYQKLQSTYKKLDDEYKKEIYSKVMAIAAKLQK